MNYLVALVAFSAVMIILSTLASVIVETLHKITGQRSSDFNAMLTKLYEDVIKPGINQGVADAADKLEDSADFFVKNMTTNPAISKDMGWVSKIPFTNLSTVFEELTTRQFIEQLRDTDAGKQLQGRSDDQVKHLISNISYEFERYGEAAKMYFHRRAAFLSILASLFLAFTLNIDAIRLYETLARNKTLAEKVIEGINIEKIEQVYTDSLNQADENDKVPLEERIKAVRQDIKNDAALLQGLGLPVGHDYFPYCAQTWESDEISPTKLKDIRCQALDPVTPFALVESDNLVWKKINGALTWLKGFLVGLWERLISFDGFVWLFRAILTGALIGLGAPFWFKAYRFISQFIPGHQQSTEDSTEARRGGKDRNLDQPVTVVINQGAETTPKIEKENASTPNKQDSDRTAGLTTKASNITRGLSSNDMSNILNHNLTTDHD